MAYYDWGNKPVFSTQGVTQAPSTTTIIAEIDSTRMGTANAGRSKLHRVTIIAGCDTNALWTVERVTSTAIDAAVESVLIRTPSGQSGQYVVTMDFEANQFLRTRMISTGANAAAYLQVEPFT